MKRTPEPPFFGRRDELAELGQLAQADNRLLSLVGPGGIGKTRLARAHADRAALVGGFLGGVWFVSLEEAVSLSDLFHALDQSLELGTAPGPDAGQCIGFALAARGRLLLILDNFEQLVPAATAALPSLMSAAPEAHFLVTTRERLRLSTERVIELEPFELPSDRTLHVTAPAAQLFIDRARRARPGFAIAADTENTLLCVLRKLGGFPLAIELAAAAMNILSLHQLDERLAAGEAGLTDGWRDAPQRHKSLEATIDWSWQLLDTSERSVLAQLAVFDGSFEVLAVEAVVLISGDQSVLRLLGRLRDKSLIRAVSPLVSNNGLRLALYPMVRTYALARLDERAQAQHVRQRHAEFFARFRTGEPSGRPVSVEVLDRLRADRTNLLQAIEFGMSLTSREGLELAMGAALSLIPLWSVDVPSPIANRPIEALVERAVGADLDPVGCARLLRSCANSWAVAGKRDIGLSRLEQAGILSAERPEIHADILVRRADLHRALGDLELAETSCAAALELLKGRNTSAELALATLSMGGLRFEQGRLELAQALHHSALVIVQERDDIRASGVVLSNLGLIEQELGEIESAERRFAEALAIHRTVGHRRFEAFALADLAGLDFERARLLSAARGYSAALELLAAVGERRYQGLFSAALGAAFSGLGQLDKARQAFDTADRIMQETGEVPLRPAVDRYRSHLGLAEALASLRARDEAPLFAALEAARVRDQAAPNTDELRLANRLLEQRLRSLSDWQTALLCSADGSWVSTMGGPGRQIKQRPIRAIVRALLAAWSDAQNGLTSEALVSIGWPNERMLAEAATNRLHVALSAIRRAGLGKTLERVESGYRMRPGDPLLVVGCV